jgi:molybdate transport system substrate-binding protein
MGIGNAPARRRLLVLVLVLAALALAAPVTARAGEVLVFAAASLKNALDEAATSYEAETGDEVKVSYAASSALAKQIEQGAPTHVFISADLDWMDHLDQRGLIARESRTNLLRNSIVLVASGDAATGGIALAPGLDLAPALGADGRLAVADVAAVPAGKYAKAALEQLGAWEGVRDRLAQAENVRAALALVSRGEAPLGIVYRTDAAADPNVKVVGAFPEGSHPPVVYPVALTTEGQAAAGFLAFLKGPSARAAFERQGFAVIADRPAS